MSKKNITKKILCLAFILFTVNSLAFSKQKKDINSENLTVKKSAFEYNNSFGFRVSNDCILALQYERYFTPKFSMDFELGFLTAIFVGFFDAGVKFKYDISQQILNNVFANRLYLFGGLGSSYTYAFGENLDPQENEDTAGFDGWTQIFASAGFGDEITILSRSSLYFETGIVFKSETDEFAPVLSPVFSAGFREKF